jgi:hypothetical protein
MVGKWITSFFTLNLLLYLTRLICLDVKEMSPNSNHDILHGGTAAKKDEVRFDVHIIIRAAPKEGLPGCNPTKSKF